MGLWGRFTAWAHRNLPTRESMEQSRILRPIAHRVLALPLRANIPAAALTTFFTNPFTTPILWGAAYWVGRKVLRLDAVVPGSPVRDAVRENMDWLQWMYAEAGPAIIVGLLVLTVVFAVLGYAITALGWRWWIAAKWRKRHSRDG